MQKKRLFICSLAFTSLVLGAGLAFVNSNKIEETKGYDPASLPTTIDLNDTSESSIRSYYSSLSSLSTSQRQGNNLLKNLKTILKNGQKYFSYENGTNVWKMYEITDRDWDKSPASAISGYNSSTNKITGYSYNSTDPYVHALYINRNVDNQTKAWANHNQDQWGINREHVWPKAEGFDSNGAGGARGDPMHLMAGNGYANNIHSNYYYGYVKTSSDYTDCGDKYSNQKGNIRGTSKTLNTGTVFEPQDGDKGDIARAIFYMVARYNYLSGSDSDGINTNNPNLQLTQNVSDWSSSGYTSSTTNPGKLGIMTDLLAWHHADPVDEYEIHRNNLLYTNFTNNRNPFIDFPEWADFIWGSVNYNGSTYVSNDTTPTGYATPSTDTINGYNSGGSTVSVTGVSLNKASTTIAAGGSEALVATVAPSNATNKAVTWTSSNTSVATVSDGVVSAKSAGNTTITVTTSDGGYTATCNVTVKALSSISVSGQTTEFSVGDSFVFGGTVTAHFSDSSTQDVTDASTFSGYNLSSAGEQTVTVSYGGKTTTYQISVTGSSPSEQTVDGSVSAASGKLDGWTSSGTASGGYSDGSVKFDSSGDNVYKVDIFSGDASTYMTNLTVTINGKINGTPTAANSYKVEALDEDGNVLANDTQTGASVVTTSYGDTVFTLSSNLSGCTGIKITYVTKGGGNWGVMSVSWTATYSVPSGPTLSSITLDTSEAKTVYTVGEEFTYEDLIVTAHYSDESEEVVVPDNVSSPDMSTAGQKTVTVTYLTESAEYNIQVNPAVPTSITATLKSAKTFYVGETITKDDIQVTTNLEDDVTDFVTFPDYQFTYEDAASGGSLTNKEFNITYSELQTTLVVQVQRKAYETPTGTVSWNKVTDASDLEVGDMIIIADSGNNLALSDEQRNSNRGAVSVTKSNNTISWTTGEYVPQQLTLTSTSGISSAPSGSFGLSTGSGFLYAASSNANQLKTQENNDINGAFVITITDSVARIEATASSNRGQIRSNYNNNPSIFSCYGTNATTGNTTEIYKKVESGNETALNVANYIMYEDTNNQCETKFDVAKGYFEDMSTSERNTFMTSSDYVISTARERLEAWAKNQGKAIVHVNGDYVIQSSLADIQNLLSQDDSTSVLLIIFASIVTLSFTSLILILKKKRLNKNNRA